LLSPEYLSNPRQFLPLRCTFRRMNSTFHCYSFSFTEFSS
jgi:hypothetical protein